MTMFNKTEYIADCWASEMTKRAKIAEDAGKHIWTTKDGRKIRIEEMTDMHILNACRLLEQNNEMDMLTPWITVM